MSILCPKQNTELDLYSVFIIIRQILQDCIWDSIICRFGKKSNVQISQGLSFNIQLMNNPTTKRPVVGSIQHGRRDERGRKTKKNQHQF